MCDARLWHGSDKAIIRAIEALGLRVSCLDFKDDASIEAMAQGVLSEHQGPLIPIGFSMGGIIALSMHHQAPKRMAALGLVDTTPKADTRGEERLRQQAEVRSGQLERIVSEELKPNYLAKCNASNMVLRALLRDMAMDLGNDVFVAQSEALRTREDLSWTMADIDVPVFIACGREDILCPPDLHKWMGEMIQGATLTIVEEAGHILPLEQPEILAAHIAGFLTTALNSTRGPKP